MKIRSADVLAGFQADLDRILRVVDGWAVHGIEALSQRPGPKRWSAIDCLEHLRRANRMYLRPLERTVAKAEAKGQRAVEHLETGAVGRRFRAQIMPQAPEAGGDGRGRIKLKVPTAGRVDPAKDSEAPVPEVTLDGFRAQIEELRGLAQRCERIDLNVRTNTAFGPLLRLKVGDVLRYLVAHMDRHLVQAERAIDAAGR